MTEPRREGISCKGETSEVPARDIPGQPVVATGFKWISCNNVANKSWSWSTSARLNFE